MRYQRGSINIAAIAGGVAIIVILLMGIALKFVYDQNSELTKVNGKLTAQVTEVTEKNTALNKELELGKKLDDTANKVSETHETVKEEIKKTADVQIRTLPRIIIREKDTKATPEQTANSVKRIDVLWLTYCESSANDPLCPADKGAKS